MRSSVVVGCALVVILAVPLRAEEPWAVDPQHPVMIDRPAPVPHAPPLSSNPFTFAFRLWSEALTRMDGPRCAHRPSCGLYAHQALQRFGVPLGIWMAQNRLMRGARSSELRFLPLVTTEEGLFYLDPLSMSGR